MKNIFIPLSTCILLSFSVSACTSAQNTQTNPHITSLHRALNAHQMQSPQVNALAFCHGHGCRLQETVGLSKAEWRKIKAAFSPRAKTPAQERAQIQKAMGLFETFIGKKTGTENDKGGTFQAAFQKGQLDCEDEMLNTGMYFILLENNKLIRHHRIAGQANRGLFLNGWPHKAVHIAEIKSDKEFVLDSWFYDNGKQAEIIDFQSWKSGWKPAKKTIVMKPAKKP